MLGRQKSQALGPLLGIEKVVDRMDGNAEGREAEDEHKTEDRGLSEWPGNAAEPEEGKEKERSQEQTWLGAMMRE
jgi:hypothetical protein